jgi:DNA-binding transcriptional ArsR family regulator
MIAGVAQLIGDPARAGILSALTDGKARTASELAYAAGVTPQTASAHLAKLTAGGLLAVERQGRHRFYRLAGPAVAHALQALSELAAGPPRRPRRTGPRDPAMRRGRTCYDHLAGDLGIAVPDAFRQMGALELDDQAFTVTASGEALFTEFGISVSALQSKSRPLTRRCLDWSERRPHLAGALGGAIAERFFDHGWIARVDRTRTVGVTKAGSLALKRRLGIDWTGPTVAYVSSR